MQQIRHEHELADQALNEMRELTSNYRLPEDACENFAALYEGLIALEANLCEHIDLENDFLWPVRLRGPATMPKTAVKNLVDPAQCPLDFCPLSGEPCEAGTHANCVRFWNCVVKTIARGET